MNSIQVTKVTNYQEGPTNDGELFSKEHSRDKVKTPGRKKIGQSSREEAAAITNKRSRSLATLSKEEELPADQGEGHSVTAECVSASASASA